MQSIARVCDGTCGQGEGDCDRNSDCLPGLICKFDWWWGEDFCEAGKFYSVRKTCDNYFNKMFWYYNTVTRYI